jgi:hypothetical protein
MLRARQGGIVDENSRISSKMLHCHLWRRCCGYEIRHSKIRGGYNRRETDGEMASRSTRTNSQPDRRAAAGSLQSLGALKLSAGRVGQTDAPAPLHVCAPLTSSSAACQRARSCGLPGVRSPREQPTGSRLPCMEWTGSRLQRRASGRTSAGGGGFGDVLVVMASFVCLSVCVPPARCWCWWLARESSLAPSLDETTHQHQPTATPTHGAHDTPRYGRDSDGAVRGRRRLVEIAPAPAPPATVLKRCSACQRRSRGPRGCPRATTKRTPVGRIGTCVTIRERCIRPADALLLRAGPRAGEVISMSQPTRPVMGRSTRAGASADRSNPHPPRVDTRARKDKMGNSQYLNRASAWQPVSSSRLFTCVRLLFLPLVSLFGWCLEGGPTSAAAFRRRSLLIVEISRRRMSGLCDLAAGVGCR